MSLVIPAATTWRDDNRCDRPGRLAHLCVVDRQADAIIAGCSSGRTIPARTLGTIVNISGAPQHDFGYEVEFHVDDPANRQGSWHLASGGPSDVEAAEPPTQTSPELDID